MTLFSCLKRVDKSARRITHDDAIAESRTRTSAQICKDGQRSLCFALKNRDYWFRLATSSLSYILYVVTAQLLRQSVRETSRRGEGVEHRVGSRGHCGEG